jgi:hypothetical protein
MLLFIFSDRKIPGPSTGKMRARKFYFPRLGGKQDYLRGGESSPKTPQYTNLFVGEMQSTGWHKVN